MIHSRFVLLVAAAALAGACRSERIIEPDPKTDPPSLVSPVRPIVFSSLRDTTRARFHLQIFAVRKDGSDPADLSGNAFNDTDPSWSADGQYIAFASDRAGGYDIYVMRGDGSSVRRLTNDPIDDRFPRWSPDGSKLIFESGRDGLLTAPSSTRRHSDLFVIDADGSHVTNITKTPGTSEGWASWSPDGKTIAYSVDGVIMLANPDGSNAHALHSPDPRFREEAAAWSPDGSMIAYSAFDNARPIFATDTYVIFTAKSDGTDVRRVTDLASSARFPAWSPDGKQLLFNRDALDETWGRFNSQNLWVMNADGTNQVRLTSDRDRRNELGGPNAWAK